MSPGRRSEAGFTLVEVLIASFVLMVGVVATLTVLTSANQTTATSQRNQVAAREAEHQLEQMRGQCYGALTMTTAHPATSASSEDPLQRVSAGKFTVKTGLAEDVTSERVGKAAGDGCTDADSDGKVDAAVTPVSTVTIGTGSTAVTGKVYRFVSWRDEECPIVNLTHLESLVQDLKTLTNGIAGPTGTLTGLIGPSGSLVNLINQTSTVAGTANSASALQKLLNPAIVTLANIVNPLLTNTLNPLLTTLTPMLAPLQAALAPLQGLLDAITQRIDLCDLPKLLDLSSFEELKTALTVVGPMIAALQAPVASVAAIVGPLASLNLVQLLTAAVNAVVTLPTAVNGLTSAVGGLTTALNQVKGTAANGQTKVKTLAETTKTAIDTLLAQPHTTHNTKRLTVAIWFDPKPNAGVRSPVWASTVVSDPKDGLL
ncbi:MAG: type IV pilus modification PilV family protein [Solirubrobacteraceae bacterium]